jgi:hypothetical protein
MNIVGGFVGVVGVIVVVVVVVVVVVGLVLALDIDYVSGCLCFLVFYI